MIPTVATHLLNLAILFIMAIFINCFQTVELASKNAQNNKSSPNQKEFILYFFRNTYKIDKLALLGSPSSAGLFLSFSINGFNFSRIFFISSSFSYIACSWNEILRLRTSIYFSALELWFIDTGSSTFEFSGDFGSKLGEKLLFFAGLCSSSF